MDAVALRRQILQVAGVLAQRIDPETGRHNDFDVEAAELLRTLARVVVDTQRPTYKRAGLGAVVTRAFPANLRTIGTPIGDALAESV